MTPTPVPVTFTSHGPARPSTGSQSRSLYRYILLRPHGARPQMRSTPQRSDAFFALLISASVQPMCFISRYRYVCVEVRTAFSRYVCLYESGLRLEQYT